MKPTSKVISIQGVAPLFVCICEDGSVWMMELKYNDPSTSIWQLIHEPPTYKPASTYGGGR